MLKFNLNFQLRLIRLLPFVFIFLLILISNSAFNFFSKSKSRAEDIYNQVSFSDFNNQFLNTLNKLKVEVFQGNRYKLANLIYSKYYSLDIRNKTEFSFLENDTLDLENFKKGNSVKMFLSDIDSNLNEICFCHIKLNGKCGKNNNDPGTYNFNIAFIPKKPKRFEYNRNYYYDFEVLTPVNKSNHYITTRFTVTENQGKRLKEQWLSYHDFIIENYYRKYSEEYAALLNYLDR